MDLSDLRALLQVVEYGSFQGASQGLRVSRSALRRQVERLERELGVELLLRGTKGIELTDAGREVVDGALGLLREANNLGERARARSREARGSLRFVVPVGLPTLERARAVLALRARHPELAVSVVEAEDPLTTLGEPFDLLFHFGPAPARGAWYSRVVLRLPLRLFASAAYLAKQGAPASVDELATRGFAAWTCPALDEVELGLLRPSTGARIEPWLRSANVGLLWDLLRSDAGLVYTLAPPWMFVPEAETTMVPVLDAEVRREVALRVLTPRPSATDPKIRALLDNMERAFASLGEGGEA